MATMIQLSKEFGFRIASFHHAVEAYKVRDLLAQNNICASIWADWWGFKLEAYDGIKENIALVHDAKGCVVVHSDDPNGIQRLNQEAAKAMRAGVGSGHEDRSRRRRPLADDQPGAGAGDRQGDRLARTGEERRRRDLVRRSVQRLRQSRAGLHRRRAALRPFRPRPPTPPRLHDRPTGPDPNSVPCSKPGATAARPNEPIAAKKPNILGSAPGASGLGSGPVSGPDPVSRVRGRYRDHERADPDGGGHRRSSAGRW